MRRMFIFLVFILLTSMYLAQTTPQWFETYGGTANDEAQASCFDPMGNYYLAGSFNGTFMIGSISLISTHQAVFIIKFSPAGEVLWAICNNTSAATPRTAGVSGIVADGSGSVYLTGFYSGLIKFGTITHVSQGSDDIFLSRFNAEGDYLWSVSLGGSTTDKTTGICTDQQGLPVIAGFYSSALGAIPNQGDSDILVAKYSAEGNLLAANHWGGTLTDNAQSIAALASGGFVIGGCYTGQITFGAEHLNAEGKEAYLCKLDNDLQPLWARGSTGSGDQEYSAVSVSAAGIFGLGKYSNAISMNGFTLPNTGNSIFYAKFDVNGNQQNLSRLGSCSTFTTTLRSVSANSQGELIAAGTLFGDFSYAEGSFSAMGFMDAFMLKVDVNGALSWTQRFGGAGYDNAMAISESGSGKYLLCGYFSEGAAFGSLQPYCAGGKDIFGYLFHDASAEIPAIPANLSLHISGNEIVLSWNAVSTAENGAPLAISGYRIYYSPYPEAQGFQLLATCAATSRIFARDEFITGRGFFRVTAYCNP